MGVTGIGSSFSYIYNAATGKLSTKDGSANDFVSYFNGELSEANLPDTLNGFDAVAKSDIKGLIELCKPGRSPFEQFVTNKEEYEISVNIVDAATSELQIDGQKVLTRYVGMPYSSAELNAFAGQHPYKVRASKPYNPIDNSIVITTGDVFNLGNGCKLKVMSDHVNVEGIALNNDATNALAAGLNSLIRFGDQQGIAGMIREEVTPMLLELLEQLGVDTSKEFIINDTTCEIKDGRIREAGNKWVVPSTIYNAALKRYENWLYEPLSERYKRKRQEKV